MKAKTIKAVLRKKINAWLDSIEDQRVRDLAAKNTIVTGGCIASMLLRESVNDYDVYFRDLDTAVAIAQYYVARFDPKFKAGIPGSIKVVTVNGRVKVYVKSAGIAGEDGSEVPYDYFEGREEDAAGEYVAGVIQDPGDIEELEEEIRENLEDEGKPPYRPVFLTTNAITLSDKMQLILRFYGKPEEIHENYDFVHCTSYWKSWDDELVLPQAALQSLLARELRYVGSKYPVCSLVRMRKFTARGWTINAGQVLKMAFQVSELDLKDVNVLEDQLVGVDVAYFAQLIRALKDEHPDKVEKAYLMEIIDRLF